MTCASCGSTNREGRRFCGRCGAAMARLCASCGAANEADEGFCGDCGVRLPEGTNAPPRSTPVGPALAARDRSAERRHVSVLFADLVGFTSLSEHRDAEDVRELLSQYFDTARTVITRYGGTVEKFIGDAVMAVWGAEAIREDDAERAVRAGLELLDAVAAFGVEVGAPDLAARAGVLTGEAAVTIGAVGEGMVAGELVNTASRVQSVAEPGSVYVGATTRQATEAVIEYADAGTHQLKGITGPLRLWRAQRVVAGRGGTLRPQGLEPPFVGRDRELRLLKEHLHATADDGTARLLSITGVAGVGKSRLAWEFFKYGDGLSETLYWHRGRCLPYGDGVAYWALGEMVRMRAGIVDNEAPAAARDKLRAAVEMFVPGQVERGWAESRLAQLVGLEDGTAGDPRDLYAAWRFFFEQVAGHAMTVLVFEDMQWADSGLLDFVEYLLEWSRNSRILVVTLARPEISELRPGWGTGKRGVSSLHLDPLTGAAMTQLLGSLLPGLPEDLGARIRERAAGIPLYAVETVRMLLDNGLLVEHDGTFHATTSLGSLEVPESLHTLIAARLDSLPAAERGLLQDAAVLGSSFTAHALAAVTHLEAAGVDTALRALVGKDLLLIQADPRSPGQGQYAFVQDLVRGVAYGTLARRDRKARHLAAATYLESAASEEEDIAEVVAAHLVEAHAADPRAADAPALRERARVAAVRAGDHAASLAAANSAQRYYERALLLGDDPAVQAGLHLRAGQMAWLQGRAPQAAQHFEASVALCAEHDAVGEARALKELAGVRGGSTGAAEAVELLERALAALETAVPGDEAEAVAAEAHAQAGKYLYFLGDLDGSLRRTEQALDMAEAAGLSEVLAIALDTKACIMAARGRLTEAQILDLAALDIAERENLPAVTVIANNAGATLEEADQPEAALSLYEAADARSRRLGDRRRAVHTTLARVEVLVELGRWDEAAALYAQYVEVDAPVIEGYLSGYAGSLNMIQVHLWRGELDSARRLLAEVEPMLAAADAEMVVELQAARAALLNAEGDHDAALAAAQQALIGSLQPSFPLTARKAAVQAVEAAFALRRPDQVEAVISMVRTRHRAGRQRSLDAHIQRWTARLGTAVDGDVDPSAGFARAVEAFDALHRPFWGAVSRTEYAEWAQRAGRADQGRELLGRARATFTDLGATPWVERVTAAEERSAGPGR